MSTKNERDREVRADMERVFGAAPRRRVSDKSDGPERADRGTGNMPTMQPASRKRGWLIVGASLVAIVVVVLLAVQTGLSLGTLQPSGSKPAVLGNADRTPDAIEPTPEATTASVDPAADMAGNMAAAAETAPPEAFPEDEQTVRATPADSAFEPRQSESTEQSAPHARETPRTPAAQRFAEYCVDGQDSDACLYRDVLRADAELRTAYQDAADAGVATARLRDVRRRWQRARAVSQEEPGATIQRYRALSDELGALTDDAQFR